MKKIFFSYDYDRHRSYKNIIKAWESTSNYFTFDDLSTDTSINSTNVSYIKSQIRNKIKEADKFVVIIGDYVSNNKWVNWEIEYAISLFKPIIAIKVKSHFTLPDALNDYFFTKIYDGFTKENLIRAI